MFSNWSHSKKMRSIFRFLEKKFSWRVRIYNVGNVHYTTAWEILLLVHSISGSLRHCIELVLDCKPKPHSQILVSHVWIKMRSWVAAETMKNGYIYAFDENLVMVASSYRYSTIKPRQRASCRFAKVSSFLVVCSKWTSIWLWKWLSN